MSYYLFSITSIQFTEWNLGFLRKRGEGVAKILKVILELKVGKNSNFQEDLSSFL